MEKEERTASAAILHGDLVRVAKIAKRLDLENSLFGLFHAAVGAKLEQLLQQDKRLVGEKMKRNTHNETMVCLAGHENSFEMMVKNGFNTKKT